MHILLTVSAEAEVFSEEYFKKLYNEKEQEWVDLKKRVSEVKFEDVYPAEFQGRNIDGSPLEEQLFKKLEKEYFEDRERAREAHDKLPPFDPEKQRQVFALRFESSVKYLQSNLPAEILQNVADIRVLALNRASEKVKKQITEYCENNRKITEQTVKDYQKEYKKQFKSKEPPFAEKLNLHDCYVLSCKNERNDIVISIDNGDDFTDVSTVTFVNCTVIKQDAPLDDACFIYDEIYENGEGYELHFLLRKCETDEMELLDFIVTADDVLLK